MRKSDLITRAVAGFVDLLIIIGLARLPDVIGFLSATGYILIRDGLFDGRSAGKKLIHMRTVFSEDPGRPATYRESIIRNIPFALAYALFLIPYAGWVLGPLAFGAECLTAIGDDQGMRIGDMLARTVVLEAPLPVNASQVGPQQQPGQAAGPGASKEAS